MASDAIVRLEQVLAYSRLIRYRFKVFGLGAHRVDVRRVKEENDEERSEKEAIIDGDLPGTFVKV